MQSCRKKIIKSLSKSCNDTLGINWYPGHKKQLGMGVQAKHVSHLPSWLLLRSSCASSFIAFCFWKPEETCKDAPWWWEWAKDKSFYSEAVVLPVSLLFAAAVTWGRNIRLCEIRSEAFSIGALLCLWSSTIQNRTRIEFPEIWKASTDTFSIEHRHRRLD